MFVSQKQVNAKVADLSVMVFSLLLFLREREINFQQLFVKIYQNNVNNSVSHDACFFLIDKHVFELCFECYKTRKCSIFIAFLFLGGHGNIDRGCKEMLSSRLHHLIAGRLLT